MASARPFLPDDFLLTTKWARTLYFEHAAPQPIFDYHCHLPPDEIAANRRFDNLYQIWLGGDHYKWRAMRSNGVPEDLITGRVTSDYEKFLAYARTVPCTLRNPLYHWSHLELRRYFGINDIINEETAPKIWTQANKKLATPELSVHGILTKFKVAVVCTTDDPVDSLEHHQAIAKSGLTTRVYPTFRPDKSMGVNSPAAFNAWTDKLAARANVDIKDLASFLDALKQRHDFFHSLGARVSDHGMENIPDAECTEAEAATIFAQARQGVAASPAQTTQFTWFMMLFFGRLDAARGWTKQLHLGAIRNNNARLLKRLGADAGVDSIGDFPQARGLARYLDRLDAEGSLPKTVLYNVNPADNYVFATMIGNVQDDLVPGKIQFGSGWWFLDQKEGMEWQINALSNLGLLSRFVGMLTDSRSFLSYVRHEYFRRVLCAMLGADIEAGLIPADRQLVGAMVENICYQNAARHFGLEAGQFGAKPAASKKSAAPAKKAKSRRRR
jgi:glucuronate isomerase